VVVELVDVLLGATGDMGEDVVLSSLVVVVVELGMELSSLAQPARASRQVVARRAGIRFFIECAGWVQKGVGSSSP
jgi:hypothetical protein